MLVRYSGVDLEAEKGETRHNGHDKKGQTKKRGKAAVETLQKVYESLKSVEDVESYSFADALKYTNAFAGRQVRPTPWNRPFGDRRDIESPSCHVLQSK